MITTKNQNKILEYFQLYLESTNIYSIGLFCLSENGKYVLNTYLDKSGGQEHKPANKFLLILSQQLAKENTRELLIKDLDYKVKELSSNVLASPYFNSCYILSINGANNSSGFLFVFSKPSATITKHEKSLLKVFIPNIEQELADSSNELVSIEDQEKKFKLIFDSVPEAISFNELLTHKTISVNKTFLKYSGYTEEEILGKSGLEMNLWVNEHERLEYRKIFEEQGFVTNFEASFKSRDGKVFSGLISGNIVEFSKKKYILVILRDISDIKAAQEELRESEKKFKLVFDSMPDTLTITDLETKYFTDVNKHFIDSSGFSRKEIIGKKGLDLNMWANESERQEHAKLISQTGKVTNFSMLYKHPNGKVVNTSVSSNTFNLNNKRYILSAVRNVDELVKVKNELKKSEEKFKMFFQSSPDAININTVPDGVFVDVNQSFITETKYSKEEIIGKSILDYNFWVNEDDFAYFTDTINEKKVVRNLETVLRSKNGNLTHSLVSAAISTIDDESYIITIARNINQIKRVQDNLEDSENKYRSIVEKSHSAIVIINENFEVTYTNNRSTKIFGYNKKDSHLKDAREVIHPESLNKIIQLFNKNSDIKSIPEIIDSQIIRKDGIVRDVEIRPSIYYDMSGKMNVIAQVLDITEAKTAVSKSKLYEDRAKKYLDIAAVMMMAIDEFGNIIMINKKACAILGYEENELIGENWFEKCTPSRDLSKAKKKYENKIKNRDSDEYSENFIVTKSGNERIIAWNNSLLFDTDGNTIGVLRSGKDITEKLNNVRIINRSRAVAIVWRNEIDFPVEYVSENVFKLLGYPANDFIEGKVKYVDLIHRDDYDRVISEVDKFTSIEGPEFYNHDYYRMITKSGKIKWIEDRTDIHRNTDGEIVSYDGVLMDVTEKKKVEKELRLAKEKAEESDKLKSSFLANMSHEIRTPMNSIIGFAGLIEDEDIDDKERMIFVNRIKKNGQLLLTLINDIIDISKIEANQVTFQFDEINLYSFFESIFDLFILEAENKGIEYAFNIPENVQDVKLYSDINRLKQVMINLVSNALKFTNKGGKVSFGTYVLDKELVFYVKDNGIGIPKREQEEMFNRFRQAEMVSNSNYGGTGLGLSISKGLIEKMGGKIWLESEYGSGTTFYFTLPI